MVHLGAEWFTPSMGRPGARSVQFAGFMLLL
jgi:hypothetical protein